MIEIDDGMPDQSQAVQKAGDMNLGWIWTGNLRPLLVELAILAGHRFDDSDWIAFEHGMEGTDAEAGPWFEYPLGHLSVTAAFEAGADEMVSVKVDGANAPEREKVGWLGGLMRNWRLSDPSQARESS